VTDRHVRPTQTHIHVASVCLSVCLSDVCLSRTSGLSREERPGKTKIGTEVAATSHVTRTPLSRCRRLQRGASERVGRGKLLLRCRLLSRERRSELPRRQQGEDENGGCISWRLPTPTACLY